MIAGMVARLEREEDQDFALRLYHHYKRLMFHIAKKWTESLAEQEDIVQDAVEKLLGKLDLLQSLNESRRAAYISHTVRNTALKHLGRKSRDERYLVHMDLSEQEDGGLPVEEQLIRKEWQREFAKIWSELPERERLLLEGKYIFHESNEDIASWMNCKPSSVRMALTRARRKILEELIRREHDAEPEAATGTI